MIIFTEEKYTQKPTFTHLLHIKLTDVGEGYKAFKCLKDKCWSEFLFCITFFFFLLNEKKRKKGVVRLPLPPQWICVCYSLKDSCSYGENQQADRARPCSLHAFHPSFFHPSITLSCSLFQPLVTVTQQNPRPLLEVFKCKIPPRKSLCICWNPCLIFSE